MRKIVIINGHPDKESLCQALAKNYYNGAIEAGAEVRLINVHEMKFNPNLEFGYRERTPSEPDVDLAREYLTWCNHVVVVFPVWWGVYPALLKGFFDRVLLPGFAFKYRDNSVWWDKLLSGKTGRIIYTIDQPLWYYRLINRRPAVNAVKKMTLEFCGIKPVKLTGFGAVRFAEDEKIKGWLNEVKLLGKNCL